MFVPGAGAQQSFRAHTHPTASHRLGELFSSLIAFFFLKNFFILLNKIGDVPYLLKENLMNPPQIPRLPKLMSLKG